MRKRLARLRKEHSAKQQQDESSSQLGARRRWSKTISFDKNTFLPAPPPITSTGSVPYLSPSPTGLSTAAGQLTLNTARSPYHGPPVHGGYFDQPGSPYPLTPGDEAPGYFVTVPIQAAPMYPPFERVTAGHSPYPLTPPDEAYSSSCANDPNCTCHYPPQVMAPPPPLPQQQQQQRRPAFAHSQSAPVLPSVPYGLQYGAGPVDAVSPYAPPPPPRGLSPTSLPPPPPYLVDRSATDGITPGGGSGNGARHEIAAPIPVRALPAQPSFIRPEPPAAPFVVAPPPGFVPYPVAAHPGGDDAFLAPNQPATWADALGEDPLLVEERGGAGPGGGGGGGGYTEMWVGDHSKNGQAPFLAADYGAHFEQPVW